MQHNSLEDNIPPTHINCQQSDDQNIPFYKLAIKKENLPKYDCHIEHAQKWLRLEGKNGKEHRFPFKTILPKVQMSKYVPARHLPRDVEADRRRRLYSQMNIMQELDNANLNQDELLPTEEQYHMLSETAFKHFLPISFFDDTCYDCHAPSAWLELGKIASDVRYPLPAKAFLPLNRSLIKYSWQNAAVSDYIEATGKWRVMILSDEFVYEVPRIQIMFIAENPLIFVERLKNAVATRNNAEKIINMQSMVDCVLLQNANENIISNNNLVEKLMVNAKIDNIMYQQLRTEIRLIFERLMACYDFEKFVQLFPKEFPQFKANILKNALSKAFALKSLAKQLLALKAFNINIAQSRYSVLKDSLYYTASGIYAMSNVASECLYIETLTIFICDSSSALPLSAFLNLQQRQSTTVANYLKNWPSQISLEIRTILKALGKGWLDILLYSWDVYRMSKIFRFMAQVKFRMQESVQVLLENSIDNFTSLLSKPCLQFLELSQDYQWTNDYKKSEFPYMKPIFSLIISVAESEEVVYSNQPEEFAPAIKEIFKKSLDKSNAIRCVDAEIMLNLQFAPNLFILTVELIEDLYIKCDELLQKCYTMAILPLRSYAKKYDRFIDFYLLDIGEYMAEYKTANKTSMQVKMDILEHKRCKEEMREILPANISIGPFLVVVEPMKQYMINKRIQIVKRIFEYYVDRMYAINENLLERCLETFNKINEKPQSIEHLYEIKDFALTIPDVVDQLRADIQIMWIEYDMLDSFFYNLSDHQFAMKWETYALPKNILDRLSTLREEQKNDIEEFKRLHLSECILFEERLESLNVEIQQFSMQFEPQKVMETAVEAKKTWKIIQDLQKLGATLRYRQKLFQLDDLSLEFLDSIIDSFMPYQNLWYACQDLVKLEEATVGNPFINIDLVNVWNSIHDIKDSLLKSLDVFNEKPEIQNVAHYFLRILDKFLPKYNAIKDLKNENWLLLHWQELALRSGMDIKYSMTMNFQYCMRKGIIDHLELVHEISEKATNDADAIRKAFEEEERRKEEERQAILMRKTLRKCRRDIL